MQMEHPRAITAALKEKLSSLHRLWQKNFYPIVLWVIVLGMLTLVVAVRTIGVLRRRRLSKRLGKQGESEGDPLMRGEQARRVSVRSSGMSARLLSSWRIVLYRWTVPIGFSYRMTMVEVVFSALYLSLLLILGLVDSASSAPSEGFV